jgi:hypothetical protein
MNDDPVYDVGKVIVLNAKQRHELSLPQRAISKLRNKSNPWDYAYFEYYLGSFKKELRRLKPAPDVVICFNDLVSPKHIKEVVPKAKVLINLQNEQGTRQTSISETIAATSSFVACSSHIKNWIQNKYNVPEQKMSMINNGIDIAKFCLSAELTATKGRILWLMQSLCCKKRACQLSLLSLAGSGFMVMARRWKIRFSES